MIALSTITIQLIYPIATIHTRHHSLSRRKVQAVPVYT